MKKVFIILASIFAVFFISGIVSMNYDRYDVGSVFLVIAQGVCATCLVLSIKSLEKFVHMNEADKAISFFSRMLAVIAFFISLLVFLMKTPDKTHLFQFSCYVNSGFILLFLLFVFVKKEELFHLKLKNKKR